MNLAADVFLREVDGDCAVRYTFRPVSEDETDFEYSAWVDQGDLKDPFSMQPLETLKRLLEF